MLALRLAFGFFQRDKLNSMPRQVDPLQRLEGAVLEQGPELRLVLGCAFGQRRQAKRTPGTEQMETLPLAETWRQKDEP